MFSSHVIHSSHLVSLIFSYSSHPLFSYHTLFSPPLILLLYLHLISYSSITLIVLSHTLLSPLLILYSHLFSYVVSLFSSSHALPFYSHLDPNGLISYDSFTYHIWGQHSSNLTGVQSFGLSPFTLIPHGSLGNFSFHKSLMDYNDPLWILYIQSLVDYLTKFFRRNHFVLFMETVLNPL